MGYLEDEQHPVETKELGTLYLWPVDADRIIIDNNSTGRYLTSRGVQLATLVRLHKYETGWELERDERGYNHHAISANRTAGSYKLGASYWGNQASDAAKRQIEAVVVPLVNEWAAAHPDLVQCGRIRYCKLRISTLDTNIDSKRRELASLQKELRGDRLEAASLTAELKQLAA